MVIDLVPRAVAAVFLLLAVCANQEKPAPGRVVFATAQGPVAVVVEVADTPAARQAGLQRRKALPAMQGMVFVFPRSAHQSFWMKDTWIPLDMIFVDAGLRVVGVVHDAAPMTLDSRSVAGASQYVIEVNGGFARDHGIEAGTQIAFERVPLTADR